METGTAITLPGIEPAPLPTTREERGRQIAQRGGIRQIGVRYAVPSQTPGGDAPTYLVDVIAQSCTCPDHELRGRSTRCKHQEAVWYWIAWEGVVNTNGTGTAPPKKRKTYPQNWAAYDEAQTMEKERIQVLLKALLLACIVEPVRQPGAPGRPRIPLADAVFSVIMKVYTTFSSRRSATDIRGCAERGHIAAPPHYSSINRFLESDKTTPILIQLIEESAAPLAQIENDRGQFAADSSGFSTVVYDRWFDQKHGKLMAQHAWVKLHMMCGTATHVVAHAKVSPEADCPVLPELIERTKVHFRLKEVSADKAYLANYNVEAIHKAGAEPFIAFKSNSVGMASKNPLWRKMYAHFSLRSEDYLNRYHRRSNAETVFDMIKAKFNGSVRSKLATAQVNEVLCKVICHNLCRIVHAVAEFGIDVDFNPKPAPLMAPVLTLVR